ncbi:MAG TPA: TetR/AcrR family transcriptional regulator [Solirubrobacteraceae bacterium]|jgi:AcrR family transcriptional regulator
MSLSERADYVPITPIYPRLPRGPHRLGREEVLHNQRKRIFGGLLHAVDTYGYRNTTVAKVIAFAGVSRRSFYEQFAGRQDCLLAVFDATVARCIAEVRNSAASTREAEDLLRAVLDGVLRFARSNEKAARITLCETPSAGGEGMSSIQKLIARCERSLHERLYPDAPQSHSTVALTRGVVGGLYCTISRLLSERTLEEVSVDELLGWIALADGFAAERLRALSLTRRIAVTGAGQSMAEHLRREIDRAEDDRTRMLFGALYAGVSQPEAERTPGAIAQASGVSVDDFLESFADGEECYQAATDMLSHALQQTLEDYSSSSAEWVVSVRRSLDGLTSRLAERPALALVLGLELDVSESLASERGLREAYLLASSLLDGAPARVGGEHATHLVAGALWRIVNVLVVNRRTHLLPAFSEHLAYLVLASCVGPVEALRAFEETQDAQAQIAAGVC